MIHRERPKIESLEVSIRDSGMEPSDVNLRNVVKIRPVPGTTRVTVDLMYYKLDSESA